MYIAKVAAAMITRPILLNAFMRQKPTTLPIKPPPTASLPLFQKSLALNTRSPDQYVIAYAREDIAVRVIIENTTLDTILFSLRSEA